MGLQSLQCQQPAPFIIQLSSPRSPPLRDPVQPPRMPEFLFTFHHIVLFYFLHTLFSIIQHPFVLFVLYCLPLPRHRILAAFGSTVGGTLSILFPLCLQYPKTHSEQEGSTGIWINTEWSAHQTKVTHLEHWGHLGHVCKVA